MTEQSNNSDILEGEFNPEKFTSEKLADMIIMYRYLGLFKEYSDKAMQELAARRLKDDPFLYEEYINQHLNELPKFKTDLNQVNNLVATLKKIIL